MVILARRYWPKECERCNWWCGTNDNATQAGPSTRGDGHRRSGAARDEEATEIQFKPKSRCDVRPGILPGKMRVGGDGESAADLAELASLLDVQATFT